MGSSNEQASSDAVSERVTFPGAQGAVLAARLETSPSPPRAYALLAHCFTCSKDLKSLRRIARGLARRGIAVLSFDFTGIGQSQGEFAATNFSTNLDDVSAAADYLRSRHAPPSLLIGHSLGGAAVLAAATRMTDVRAVATIAAPSDTQHLHSLLVAQAPQLASQPEAEISLGGKRFRIRRQFLEDLERQSILDAAALLRCSLLVFHSPIDSVVPVEHGYRIFSAASDPKSFISLDDADHLMLDDDRHSQYIVQILAGWVETHLT